MVIWVFLQAAFFVSLDDEPQNYDPVSTYTKSVYKILMQGFLSQKNENLEAHGKML